MERKLMRTTWQDTTESDGQNSTRSEAVLPPTLSCKHRKTGQSRARPGMGDCRPGMTEQQQCKEIGDMTHSEVPAQLDKEGNKTKRKLTT